jgi:hypothetical protein
MLTCSYSFCYKVSGIVLSIKHLMARPLIGDQFPYICCSLFHKAFAASPAFDQIFIPDQETSNQKNDWVQTYGNDSTHLRSDHANILAVDYLSDGKTLDATFWLASNLENELYIVNHSKGLDMVCLLPLFPCLQLQDITEPITTFILKQLMEDGVNIFTNYHKQVLLHL